MKRGGCPRRRSRAAAALVALTLVPVALMVAAVRVPPGIVHSPGASLGPIILHPEDAELPSADAIRRGLASNLFAPFSWDGRVSSGPFVRFGFFPDTGTILSYSAVNGTETTVLMDALLISNFTTASPPVTTGATFIVAGAELTVVAHDEPMGLLEIRTFGTPHEVTLQLPQDTSTIRVSYSASWPASSLSYTDRHVNGRIVLGYGNFTITGKTVTASLGANDYLAIRALPEFLEDSAERMAILDAFTSGRLAAEVDLVAVSGGGWIENLAQYRASAGTVDRGVQFRWASLQLGMPSEGGGLVLLAFDPETMPVDDLHRLVVRANSSEVPKASDSLAAMLSAPATPNHPMYTRLAMNATVLAVYVPSLNSTSLQIESLELPSPGTDRPLVLAIAAAMFVVTVAAAVMFRRDAA